MLAEIIESLHPGAIARGDVVVRDTGHGPNIVHWSTAALGEQPSKQSLLALGDSYRLAQAVAAKKRAIEVRFESALATGMAYGGKVLQIREIDQQNLIAMGQEARWAKATGAAWPNGFAWRMADNSFLSVPNADAMIAMGEAAKAEVYRLRQVKWGHDDTVSALLTPEAVAAYNIETGW